MIAALALLTALQNPNWEPPRYELADGKSFGGITFGEDTDGTLKKRFRTDRGAIRPEGLVLAQAADKGLRVDALLAGRGKDAPVIALRLQFQRFAPSREAFEKELGGETEARFARNRYSDWAILTHEEKGVAAFAIRERNETIVESLIFTTPARIRELTRGLSAESGEIGDLQREFDRLDRTVKVRSTSVSISAKNITTPDRNRESRDLERYADRRFESRVIRYGGDGSISISVSLDFDKITLSASLSAKNEAGPISVSASKSGRFREANDIAYYDRGVIQDLLEDALDELSDDAERAVDNQRPPTEQEERSRAILDLINRAIR